VTSRHAAFVQSLSDSSRDLLILGNKDGTLVFVVQSNEDVVTYETDTVGNSSSGVGWLVLFIILIVVYSVCCCFFGAFCIGRVRNHNYKSSQSGSYKSFHEDINMTETTDDSRAEIPSSESVEPDIEDQQKSNSDAAEKESMK
jgi:hypothetical protein